MCPSLGTQVFHCLEVPIKIGTSAFNCSQLDHTSVTGFGGKPKSARVNQAWWDLKWRRDHGWNTWKHNSCFEEEMTKLSVHFQLLSHITAQSTAQSNMIHGAGQHRLCLAWSCKDDTVQVSQKMVRGKYDIRALVFSVFRAFSILNGYVQSVQMEWARKSDSETLVKNNRSSGTDLS